MRESPLFIPRVARLRIMALADATRRRIFKDQEIEAATATSQLEAALVQGDRLKTKMVAGMEGEFTTKADMKKAWAMKLKEDEKEDKQMYQVQMRLHLLWCLSCHKERRVTCSCHRQEYLWAMQREYEQKHKVMPDEVYRRIREVAAQAERDDVDCLIHVHIPTDSHWCCDVHGEECLRVRDATTQLRSLNLQADLQVAVDRIDFYSMGVVSRYQLELIVQQYTKKLRLENAISDDTIRRLLDSCVMSEDEQQWQREWTSQVARESPLTDLPLRAYSAQTFVTRTTELLLELELKRLFHKSFDDE